MAAVLEVFPVTRISAGRRSASTGTVSTQSPVFGCWKQLGVPGTQGLRMVPRPVRVSLSVGSSILRRSGPVVSELSDTTTQVPPVDEGMWQSLVIEEEQPVIVEFWAPWCGPCRMIDPVIGELAVQYAGKLKFYKLNTDESPKIATQYGIRSIPTVMIFRGGEKKEAIIGAVPKTTLSTLVNILTLVTRRRRH